MSKKEKILNLYAGLGGNRRLWDGEVTAVEIDQSIANIYSDFFPKDEMIVGDAHQYLLDNYEKFDFIWSSPPCPTHSRMNFLQQAKGLKMRYPDLKLYEGIIFLKHFFRGKWVVENVKSYYEPLILPQETARHYLWANFEISPISVNTKVRNDKGFTLEVKMEQRNMIIEDFHGYKGDKRTLLNNMIEPELGLHIFNESKKEQAKLL